MPNYSFKCDACDHCFELFLKMSESDSPIKEKCPNCKKKKVRRHWEDQKNSIAMDITLSPTKVNGGAWKEVMDRVKSNVPKRYHDKLDYSSTLKGGRFVR